MKDFKKLMVVVIGFCLVFLSACSKEKDLEEPIFNSGDIVVSVLGESYTQFITGGTDKKITGEVAIISSHTITATRELDINNADDYAYNQDFYRYLYTAKVIGKVDSKYAGQAIYVYTSYPISVQTCVFNDYNNGALILEDGSFVLDYYVYTNEILEYFTPHRISVGS